MSRLHRDLLARFLLSLPVYFIPSVCLAHPFQWQQETPAPNTEGQVEGIADFEVAGSINAATPHPSDANILFVGAVGGGVWRTENATDSSPKWQSLTDKLKSLSISALEYDLSDSQLETLVAGTGQTSSFGGEGILAGVFKTVDGGDSWSSIDGKLFIGQSEVGKVSDLDITGISGAGDEIVVTSRSKSGALFHAGVWRSKDNGQNWSRPLAGPSFDLARHPVNLKLLYSNGNDANGQGGIFKSTDHGETWTKDSTAEMDGLLGSAENVQIAVGKTGAVLVVVASNSISGVFHRFDATTPWKPLGIPLNGIGGINPGGQADTHLSVAVDPVDGNIVYVGGDRQDGGFPPRGTVSPPPKNAIGATDYVGALARGDASKLPASQWVHLTHTKDMNYQGGGTANSSAPHADSRDMDFDAAGNLLETNDGGIYRRTSPADNTGDWFSMNGNIQVAEFHSAAWDRNSNIITGGTQDTGTPEQLSDNNSKARTVVGADGGVVAVNSIANGNSIRYTSIQNLGFFTRRIYNQNNQMLFEEQPTLASGVTLRPQFYTPIKINKKNPNRILIGGFNGVFESFNRADTLNFVSNQRVNAFVGNPIAYGTNSNERTAYFGSANTLFSRTGNASGFSQTSYTGGTIIDLAVNFQNEKECIANDASNVFRTTDGGTTWDNITNNLSTFDHGALRSLEFVEASPNNFAAVGSDRGIYVLELGSTSAWVSVSGNLPNAPVFHLQHSVSDNLLMAATLGRGAWTMPLQANFPQLTNPQSMVAAMVPTGMTSSADDDSPEPVELVSGVIVDKKSGQAYIMKPSKGVASIKIATGDVSWSTEETDKPIGLSAGKLVTQVDNSTPGNLKISVISSSSGDLVADSNVPLAGGVVASVEDTGVGTFAVSATSVAGEEAVLDWSYETKRKSGRLSRTEYQSKMAGGRPPVRGLGPELSPAAADSNTAAGGSFKLNLGDGKTTKMDSGIAPTKPTLPAVQMMVPMHAKIPAGESSPADSPQVFSADNKHILVATANESGDLTRSYKLTFFEANTKKEVGSVLAQKAAYPFVIVGGSLVLESSAYKVRSEGDLKVFPRSIRCFNLADGSETWSEEIRETNLANAPH